MQIKPYIPLVAKSFVLFALTLTVGTAAKAAVIDFEDLPPRRTFIIPTNYLGYHWSGFYLNKNFPPVTPGTIRNVNGAQAALGGQLVITFPEPILVTKAQLGSTAAFGQARVSATLGGVTNWSLDFFVTPNGPTAANFPLLPIDRIVFRGLPGPQMPPSPPPMILIDDITTMPYVPPDTTPPTIVCPPTEITVGCSLDRLAPVSWPADYVTATDNRDPNPIVTYSPASGSGFPVGQTAVLATATDADGNSSTCSFNVTRAALGFTGFLPPVGGADATGGSFSAPLRTFKLGSTIPFKFTASCNGSAVLTGSHTLRAEKYTSATTSEPPIEVDATDSATTGNEFRLADGEWHFNLDTKSLAPALDFDEEIGAHLIPSSTALSVGLWRFVVTLSDGSEHDVWLQLK